jgi:pimeloyl-ACP methyl ester carboxylesterase
VRSISQSFDSGSVHLAGTLVIVGQTGPGPVVLLISGSGPLDRDSNSEQFSIDVMKQIADHVARAGLSSFRYDKRGVGESGGDFMSTGLHDNIDDAAAAVDMLRARGDIDPDRIIVVGHSEGAVIATELAAADPRLAGVALLAGTATPGADVVRWQTAKVSDSQPRPLRLLLKILGRDLVRTQNQRLERITATTGDTARIRRVQTNVKWWREFLAHDPAPSLESIRVPVLALTGSNDIQVDPDNVRRIARLVSAPCSAHIVDGLTHLLRTEAGPPSLRTYTQQVERPVDAELLATVTTWAQQRAVCAASEAGS